MTTVTDSRVHRGDPASSHRAAANLNESNVTRLKAALVQLLSEQSAAPFEVQMLYVLIQDVRGWPTVQPHSVNRRLSELKKAGVIRGTGEFVRTPDGADAERLEVTS